MQEKLQKFIKNQFTNKELNTNSEYIKEITSNIIERYNDEISKGCTENEAYIKCIDFLGNIRSGANIEINTKTVKTYPITLYITIAFTLAAFIVFNINTFWGLVLLCLTIVIFYYELRNQINNTKNNKPSYAKIFLKNHKYLLIVWSFIFSMIIIETITNFSLNNETYVRLTIDMYINSEPFGMLLLMNLVFTLIMFIPFSFYHNRLVESYNKYDEVNNNIRHRIWKEKQIKSINFTSFKNREFIVYTLLMLLGISFVLLSKVYLYLLGYDPVAGEILGLQLAATYTYFEYAILHASTSWPSVIMFSSIIIFVVYIILSIFIKRIRDSKYIKIWSVVFITTILLSIIIQAFFTGVNFDFALPFSTCLALITITYVFKHMFDNLKVLRYE